MTHHESPSRLTVSPKSLERLGRMADAAASMQERTRTATAPAPGSSLAADRVEGLDVDGTVWYLMCVAAEHLDFALDSIKATGCMYPSAYTTVARTALIGASNALWVLTGSSRAERRIRALRVRANDVNDQIKAARELPILDDAQGETHAEYMSRLEKARANLERVGTSLGSTTPISSMGVNQTQVVKFVADRYDDDELFAAGLKYLWRSGSAAAHAQFHYAMSRLDYGDLSDQGDGFRMARFGGDVDRDLVPSLAGPLLVLQEAFKYYDLRRESPFK